MIQSALLVLEDGTKFYGRSIGVIGITVGEVVFNTSMTGYQEILTDPSYFGQIITLTYPHIGNVGINFVDEESSRVYANGLIIRDLSLIPSNYRSEESLSMYLQRNKIVAISDIDTRKLTRVLRKKGVQHGCIIASSSLNFQFALQKALSFQSLKGVDLVKQVTTKRSYTWNEGFFEFRKEINTYQKDIKTLPYKVVVYDYGVKRNILRMLVNKGCSLVVVPARNSVTKVLELKPDGIFLSNGPGDPSACKYAIETIRVLLQTEIPIFGVCFGHQLLALASGAKVLKMKFGHRGANHPVKDIEKNTVIITSQNHGFTVEDKNFPVNLRITHISLFDKTIQGIHRIDKPAFSFQGHPEASPGPNDAEIFFDYFIELIKRYRL